MADATGATWRTTLGEVERAVGDCLAALERYETTFAAALRAGGPNPAAPRPLAGPGENPGGWAERLAAAEATAAEVERLLGEQEDVWGRWQGAFSAWRRRIERPTAGADQPQGA